MIPYQNTCSARREIEDELRDLLSEYSNMESASALPPDFDLSRRIDLLTQLAATHPWQCPRCGEFERGFKSGLSALQRSAEDPLR